MEAGALRERLAGDQAHLASGFGGSKRGPQAGRSGADHGEVEATQAILW